MPDSKQLGFEGMIAVPAIRKICRWKEPSSSDATPIPHQDVAFARAHSAGFFRAVRRSLPPKAEG